MRAHFTDRKQAQRGCIMAPGWTAHKSSGCGRNTGGPEQRVQARDGRLSDSPPEMRPAARAVLMGAGAEGTPAQSAARPSPLTYRGQWGKQSRSGDREGREKVCFGIELKSPTP